MIIKNNKVNSLEKIFTLVIGAQKSGTTTMHNLLSSHPEISVPGDWAWVWTVHSVFPIFSTSKLFVAV